MSLAYRQLHLLKRIAHLTNYQETSSVVFRGLKQMKDYLKSYAQPRYRRVRAPDVQFLPFCWSDEAETLKKRTGFGK